MLAGIVAWYLVTGPLGLVSPRALPSPQAALTRLVRGIDGVYAGSTLLSHTMASLQVVALGFLTATVIGIPLGIAMGWWRGLDRLVYPLFNTLRPIPPLAWAPLALLWFGIGTYSKVFVIFLAAFVPSVINSALGVREADPVLVAAAKTCGARGTEILREVAVPSALPTILSGLRISAGVAWMTLVAAELLASVAGLGHVMTIARRSADPAMILVPMLIIGLLGALLNQGLLQAERRLCRWNTSGSRD